MKKLLLIALLLPGIVACKKKNKSTEYFSFDADGVHYDYPQDETNGGLFGGPISTLGAGAMSGGLGYQIYAFSLGNPVARGEVNFNFPGNSIPSQDTVYFNGVNNSVSIGKFLNSSNNYELRQPLSGRIIFTERSNNRLTGTFEFDAYKMKVVDMNQVPTDTIIHIANGKFSIIPAQ